MGGYNHYSWCNCGWCVKDRGYRYTNNNISKTKSNLYINSEKIETYESFTIPNIKCNCCGQEIYFYQSPYKGKVFFNELGHPWEKHCCEPKCCAEEKENIPHSTILDKNRRVNLINEPLWQKDGWIPAVFIREEKYNSLMKRIIIKSMNNYKEYVFFISFSLNIKKNLVLNFKLIDNKFIEISFYIDSINKKYIVIASKYPNSNDFEEFIYIKNNLNLANADNREEVKLARVFFKILNISNRRKGEIFDYIIQDKSSKKSGMSDIYEYIIWFGIQKFEEKFSNNFELYEKEIIDIFSSLQDIVTLNNIHKIILEKMKEKTNIKKSKKSKGQKSILHLDKIKWSGIFITKPKES